MKARLAILTSDGPLEIGWVLTLERDNARCSIQTREGCDMRELLKPDIEKFDPARIQALSVTP